MPALHPDPILELDSVLGYSVGAASHVLWVDDETLVYCCKRTVVLLNIRTRDQRYVARPCMTHPRAPRERGPHTKLTMASQ